MKLVPITGLALATLLGACSASTPHATAPQRAAQQAEEDKQAAQESARSAREQSAREQQQAQEAKRAEQEANQKAQWASERAALAEAQATREAKWQSESGKAPSPSAAGKGQGTTERQAEPAATVVTSRTDVLFDVSSAELSADAKAKLDQLAQGLRAQPQAHDVLVQGYTDDAGPESTNVQLSERRAQSVADYLQSKGVPRDRLAFKALGSLHPATREATDRGRALNRRVEVVVQPVVKAR